MNGRTVLVGGMISLLAACATPTAPPARVLIAAPAPITFDGHVAGQATDYVFLLVPDADPAVRGLALRPGETLRLVLPPEFKRNVTVPVAADMDVNLVLTKGWPQGAVYMPSIYRVDYEKTSNAMVVTAIRNVFSDGMGAPGIKVIHLRGRTFTNPMPGRYPVTVTHTSADGEAIGAWQGQIHVLDGAPSTRLAPTNFHLQPGANADFQKVAAGQVTVNPLGLLLWGESGEALNNVGIAARDLARYPRFTGGLLVQDSNGDKRLDPAVDRVVGGIVGAAPQGAKGQAATSPLGPDGMPVLSGAVSRHVGYPARGGGGKPNPGLLTVQFKAGDLPGLYRPTFELIAGNSYQFTVEVVSR